MKALTWHRRHDVRIADVPEPAIVNPHDAVIKVSLTSICSSDLHLYNGVMPGMRAGDIIGHEPMGEVVATGKACERVRVGDRVVVLCSIACGRCWFCTHGQHTGCDNTNPAASKIAVEEMFGHAGAALFGYSHLYGGYAGGQAEYLRVPFADVGCLPVPPDLSDEQVLFLGDALPTGYMAAHNCNIQPGDTIAVFGCGAVGQFAIRSALLLGANRVIAIDSIPERLRMAADGGALVLDENHGSVLQRLDDLTGGRGPDACIDAVGDRLVTLRTAILACRKFGTISVPGVYGGVVDKFPLGAAVTKSLTLRMGQAQFHRFAPELLRRIQLRQIDPSFVITHRVSLAELPRAYEMFNAKSDGCIKVVARP